MARAPDPRFAARLATGVSEEQRQVIESIADAQGVKPAVVVRWAIVEYIARKSQDGASDAKSA